MPYMFLRGVARPFFVIITASNYFAPLHPLRTADVPDFPTTAPRMLSTVSSARPDDVDLALHRLTYGSFPTLDETLWSNHI